MPTNVQKMFGPLCRLAHLPDGAAYQRATRAWMLDRLLAEVDLAGVRTVVEVGCGNGYVCGRLAQRFPRVVGFDLNTARIDRSLQGRALLVTASAEEPAIAVGTADLVISLLFLEHVPDRIATLRRLRLLLGPGGRMIHLVPTAWWKWFQWAGFLPDVLRKQARGVTRALAGQRPVRKAKIHPDRQTNNPMRTARRSWRSKMIPRVHGEYRSNLDEMRQWRRACWAAQFGAAGLSVRQVVSMGIGSPYAFGLSRPTGRLPWTGIASTVAFVLEPKRPGQI